MTVRLDGLVTKGTKANLIEGVRSSAMLETAVDAVFGQVSRIAHDLIQIYQAEIAEGEVGQEGTGRVTGISIISAKAPTALIYGRVQSGKTVAMILTAALCLDNGFKVVVVLTTDNVALVKQTADRFRDLAGPRVFAGVKDDRSYDWEGQEADLKRSIPDHGMVIVCAKNSVNLPEVMKFLEAVDAAAYPVLVLDDEADAATPDTTTAARAKGGAKAPKQPSRMYRLVIENQDPNEPGYSLRERLPHSLYVQVTATPYVLFLQREGERLRPSGTFLLEPGAGYTGGDAYFGSYDPSDADAPKAPIVLVDAAEGTKIKTEMPEGLAQSIDFFILSSCALARKGNNWPKEGYKHLSHTSHTTTEHKTVADLISRHLNKVRQALAAGTEQAHFQLAYEELRKTIKDAPALADLLETCRRAISHADVYRVNSKVKPLSYGPRLNLIVGGNILGRGLTIGDLLVTYYVREAKVSQMDTVWQHARMFGYRAKYLDYTRVYLPQQLARRFNELHQGEELLRKAVRGGEEVETILIRLPASSRATRPNVLDHNIVRGIRAGRRQVNPSSWVEDSLAARKVVKLLKRVDPNLLRDIPRDQRGAFLSFIQCRELIQNVAVAKDDVWDRDVVTALFKNFEDTATGPFLVYVRSLDPASTDRTRGRLSGPEINLLRRRKEGRPALALLHIGDLPSPRAWFPTVVMPADSPGFVFSAE